MYYVCCEEFFETVKLFVSQKHIDTRNEYGRVFRQISSSGGLSIYFCDYRNYGGSRELVGLEFCSLAMQEQL